MATRRSDAGGLSGAPTPPSTQTEEIHTGEAQRPTSSRLLIYRGGAVQTSPRIYLVLWGSSWAEQDRRSQTAWPNRLHSFYLGLGGSRVANVLKEYKGSSGGFTNPTGQYRGYIRDNSSVPTNPTVTDLTNATKRVCKSGERLQLQCAIRHRDALGCRGSTHHPTQGLCVARLGEHSLRLGHLYRPAVHAVLGCAESRMRWRQGQRSKGVLDGVTINALHEYTESVNDPGLNAWSDNDGDENADKCSWTLLANVKLTNGKLFPAQPTWSNAKRKQYGYGCSYSP